MLIKINNNSNNTTKNITKSIFLFKPEFEFVNKNFSLLRSQYDFCDFFSVYILETSPEHKVKKGIKNDVTLI